MTLATLLPTLHVAACVTGSADELDRGGPSAWDGGATSDSDDDAAVADTSVPEDTQVSTESDAGAGETLAADASTDVTLDSSPKDASTDVMTDTAPPKDASVGPPMEFNVIWRQTVLACSACGIWFHWQGVQSQKPRLVIKYEHMGSTRTAQYQHGLGGMENAFSFSLRSDAAGAKHEMLIKKSPARHGLFRADISDIPVGATIVSAELHLHLHSTEGLAFSDQSSVLEVHACNRPWNWDEVTWTHYAAGKPWTTPGGDFGPSIRLVRAKEDMVDRGFTKASPNGFFDFTPYVKSLQAAR